MEFYWLDCTVPRDSTVESKNSAKWTPNGTMERRGTDRMVQKILTSHNQSIVPHHQMF